MSEARRTPADLDYSKLQHMDAARIQMENCAEHMSISGGTRCDAHEFGPAIFACRHCTQQDEIHPVGLACMPKRYYLCMDCLELLERRKFKMMTELIVVCKKCIENEITRLITMNPDLYRDFLVQPVRARRA